MTKLIPPHFCEEHRTILRELVVLLDRSESEQQRRALTAAIMCTLERMSREYIEIRPGRFIWRGSPKQRAA